MASPGERAAVMGALVVLTIAAIVSSDRNVTLVKLIDIPYQTPPNLRNTAIDAPTAQATTGSSDRIWKDIHQL